MWILRWLNTKNNTIEVRIQSFKIKKKWAKKVRENIIQIFYSYIIFLILISYIKFSDKFVRFLRFDRLAPKF
jgi:hypothetical protein